jgi:hypothetical protein
MIDDGGVRWIFLGGAAGVIGLAVILRPDEPSVSALGLIAGLCVAAFALLSLLEPARALERPGRSLEVAPIVNLRQSFRDGRIGQERIVEALSTLERNARGRSARPRLEATGVAPEERSPEEFRRWVVERLDELERAT